MATFYQTATTLDGFIATDDHSLDWLFRHQTDPDRAGEDFLERTGAIVMGASTYTWVAGEAGASPWPYAAPTWVLTHRGAELEASRPDAWADADLRFVAADGAAELRALHAEISALAPTSAGSGSDLWLVGGGALVAAFAAEGLLDEVILDYAPVTLGSGAPLLAGAVDLRLRSAYANGDFIHAEFDVKR